MTTKQPRPLPLPLAALPESLFLSRVLVTRLNHSPGAPVNMILRISIENSATTNPALFPGPPTWKRLRNDVKALRSAIDFKFHPLFRHDKEAMARLSLSIDKLRLIIAAQRGPSIGRKRRLRRARGWARGQGW